MHHRQQVLLTVDWETDSGAWGPSDGQVGYGGILAGTPALTAILDDLHIPCTWLVECHAEESERDLPQRYPLLVRSLVDRQRDEVGAHIHWARRSSSGWQYPVWDAKWIEHLLAGSVESLGSLGVQPSSFRGGAFLQVPNLVSSLSRYGYMTDSTSFRRNTATYPPTFGYAWRSRAALFCPTCIRPCICGPIVHLPVAANVQSIWTYGLLRQWVRLTAHVPRTIPILVLYLHVHQLTVPKSDANWEARADPGAVTGFRDVCRLLLNSGARFVTMAECAKSVRESDHESTGT